MSRQNHGVHLCSFVQGHYFVRSRSGKQTVVFEDSDQFGPSLYNVRTTDVKPIADKHWFWKFYTPWLKAGRPTDGEPMNTPFAPIQQAKWIS